MTQVILIIEMFRGFPNCGSGGIIRWFNENGHSPTFQLIGYKDESLKGKTVQLQVRESLATL